MSGSNKSSVPGQAEVTPNLKQPHLDLIALRDHYDVTIEPPEPTPDADLRRQKERYVFIVALIAAAATLGGCAWALFAGNLNETDKRWLQSVITFILGGLFSRALK